MSPSLISRLALGLVLLSFINASLADAPATRPVPPSAKSFAGDWITSYGVMSLQQTGEQISGAYGPTTEAHITGKLSGNRFTFTYNEPTAKGEGWFELSADGSRFAGKWREAGTDAWLDWIGKRKSREPENFTGLWKTSFGRMRLHQSGNAVRGIFDFNGKSKISGSVDNGVLSFTYEQADGEKGLGSFTLAPDAQTFAGSWKGTKDGATRSGPWSASRILPQPNRVWLVVLEANWERDLEEEEFSFGVMLRTFFARVPAVKVRQRFFGDVNEFRRWCDELPYLAEPVYLHISSHGDKDGIHTGGKIIDAKILADCLRDIGELRLVHFGTCLVAGGDIPKQIYAELGDSAHFPISGYANVADWAGSAVIDFTYLDLIFSRNLSPAQALQQTRRMLTFAGEHHNPGDAIAPAGLVIHLPSSAHAPEPATQPAHARN